MQESIRIDSRRAVELARELHQEVRDSLNEQGRKEPIVRIEVCRLLGQMHVHCVPMRFVERHPGEE